jgi:hypothetical protein
MPCPPDPAERELIALEYEQGKLNERFNRFREELCSTRALFASLLQFVREDSLPEDLRLPVRAQIELYRSQCTEKQLSLPTPPAPPQSWPSQDDVVALSSYLSSVGCIIKTVEQDLCAARDLLGKVVAVLDASSISKEWLRDWSYHRKQHLKHRREDRDAVARGLRIQCETDKRRLSAHPEAANVSDTRARLADNEAKLARIEALTDEELLADRNLF